MRSGLSSAGSRRGAPGGNRDGPIGCEGEPEEADLPQTLRRFAECWRRCHQAKEKLPIPACNRRPPERSDLAPAVEFFQAGQPFEIGDIAVSPFTIPTTPPTRLDLSSRLRGAYGLRHRLGTFAELKAQLKGDLLLLESNHDLEICATGPTPGQ